jgi:hypothetical protein
VIALVKPGDVIEDVYFAVPEHYGIGERYPTFLAAVRGALALRERVRESVRAGYPPEWPDLDRIADDAAKVKCVVDVRWVIRHADGSGSIDTVIKRENVDHLSVEHCERMEALAT